tara:strand:- start:306 stop:431 length:126 start_codon:yes stop_codon:yes gene_type:complete
MEDKIADFKKTGLENDKKIIAIQRIENNLRKLTEINKFKDH